jgi:hypothetical protein
LLQISKIKNWFFTSFFLSLAKKYINIKNRQFLFFFLVRKVMMGRGLVFLSILGGPETETGFLVEPDTGFLDISGGLEPDLDKYRF